MADVYWQNTYKIALFEDDSAMLRKRIDAALQAIRQHLTLNRGALSEREYDDLDNALHILRLLGKESES